ncbi:MAG: [NiFe] hydrogenase diaphorase moiety large subunit [Bacteroidota bacterium]|nr:[NiFe] hydrogenase diaphorase moiety large subunit [Bacteroidota bacterium]
MLVSEKNALTLEIEQLVERFGKERQVLLPILQEIQEKQGHISDFAQQEIARLLDIHPVEVYGVVTFYSFLRSDKKGRYNVRLCRTISCDLAGKEAIARSIERELRMKFGETSKDEKFTLEYINCMGMCDCGPAMLINDEVYTQLTPHLVADILKTCI